MAEANKEAVLEVNDERLVQVNVWVPKGIWQRSKQGAIKHNQTAREFLIAALELKLSKEV